jgi:hypothetical protein
MRDEQGKGEPRPGDEPGQAATLKPRSPNVTPTARRPESREVRELRWLIGALKEERLSA